MKPFIIIGILLMSAAIAFSQGSGVTAEVGNFGTVPAKQVNLSVPAYPDDALKKNLGGRITVAVMIDETGKVVSTGEATGPYPVCGGVTDPSVLEMREAALNAAKEATFEPVMANQKAITVSGTITYIFKPEHPADDGATVPVRIAGAEVKKPNQIQLDRIATLEPTDGGAAGGLNQTAGTDKSAVTDKEKSTEGDAQPAPAGPKTVSAGVLNGKAVSLPKPLFPPAANAVHASGAVAVQVLILEDGSMYTAKAISGHPLLGRASEVAACGARFPPTLLQGQPVKVSGVITYNFVP
jgi:outer membrane biosynthesis protein TonB